MIDDRQEKSPEPVTRPVRGAQERYPFTSAAEVVDIQATRRVKGRTCDLSRGGCYIDTIDPFPTGAVVKMRLLKERESFETQARVVYSKAGMGMSLSFLATEPEQLWILEKWIAKLSGESPPESDAPGPGERPAGEQSLKQEQRYVLNELILALMRKGVLPEADGNTMLRRLFR